MVLRLRDCQLYVCLDVLFESSAGALWPPGARFVEGEVTGCFDPLGKLGVGRTVAAIIMRSEEGEGVLVRLAVGVEGRV